MNARIIATSRSEADDAGATSVVSKIRLILDCFRVGDHSLSLTEISRRTGVAKASVHRLNQELLEWGMLERQEHSYRLGIQAFDLGTRVARSRVLRELARPHMARLNDSVKETVHLAIADGTDVLYLESVTSGPGVTRPSRIEERVPLHSTAIGKVLLAFGPPSLFDDAVAAGLTQRTALSIVMPEVLREQVLRVRAQGFAIEQEDTATGYCSVAVPIVGKASEIIAAISIIAPALRVNADRFVNELNCAAQAIADSNTII